jgi:alanine racemase
VRHCANTAGLLRLPEGHLDLCRPGIGLYGYVPSPHVPDPGLRPVLAWYSRVALVKELHPGEAVSYGGTYVARGRERVATLPVGYADGFARAFSNRGHVLIGGAPAPVRGRVCMDQVVVSVDGCGPVRQGDLAVLLGGSGLARRSADDLARELGTISYEVLCGISPRVPRVYRGF